MVSFTDSVGVRERENIAAVGFSSSCDARMCLYLGGMRGQDVDYIFSSEWDQGSFSEDGWFAL